MYEDMIEKITKIENGFKETEHAANLIISNHSVHDCFLMAKEYYQSEHYQVRSLAAFICGAISSGLHEALVFLKEAVSLDTSWQVQEILAKAFDRFCHDRGYENSLPVMEEWLNHSNPNVRRAVIEGLRIWTGRDYFKQNPGEAIKLLANVRNDPSEYVRKSVGNALKDISKKHGELVEAELQTWDLSQKSAQQVYKLARKHLEK
ncbi:DNA alkylation repair protein [Propionispora vibrioides]|uniref:DNA alkylation repair enzyme n=1 Tax=Propionispora vibrioides TaxID=112903 RepID=A0A1H8XMZ8_9FIRM|nr:DNA alkylation repair protein [Propionispora vibrioides]SEP41092.1 DNA alkylation repair enzyme [Propionispora vibrioides]